MKTYPGPALRPLAALAAGILLMVLGSHPGLAYTNYTAGCQVCHGDFPGPTSPKGVVFPEDDKHEMHRGDLYMATDCDLCHSGTSRKPVYIGFSAGTANNPGLGCSGCHVGAGLRAHHAANGIFECFDCHAEAISDLENVPPPYYGTADTRANNPGNTVLMANTNENWSIGDYLGLDNDGNNLYDLADYAVGPFRLLSAKRAGNDVLVTWLTAGGRTNRVLTSANVAGSFSNLSSLVAIPGVGSVTTNYLDVGGATNAMRYYRLKAQDH